MNDPDPPHVRQAVRVITDPNTLRRAALTWPLPAQPPHAMGPVPGRAPDPEHSRQGAAALNLTVLTAQIGRAHV